MKLFEGRNFVAAGLFLLALTLLAFAEGPILGITGYSTVPGEVYPGASGYIQINLENTGDANAQSVTANYLYRGAESSTYLGEVVAGSTAQVLVPFKVGEDSSGTIQLIDIDVYYSHKSGNDYSSKKTSLSIPLVVEQYKPLEVRTVSMDKASISPGEKLAFTLEIRNTGGTVDNLVISLPANSSFSLDGASQKSVGNIEANGTESVSITLVSSSSASLGAYGIPVEFTYQNALKQPTSETLPIGPISVLDTSTQTRITLEALGPVEIGSDAAFRLTLENAGSSPVSGVVDINSTDVLTPLGIQRIYFTSVPAGSSESRNISIGISTSTPGYYTLPLSFTPDGGKASVFNAGIPVVATPEITVSIVGSLIQVANTGNSAVRSVYVIARPAGSTGGTSESFMGTLNVDDFSTLDMPSMGFGPASSNAIEVEIRFRDTNNAEHVLTKAIDATSAVFSTNATNMTGFAGAGRFQQQAGIAGIPYGTIMLAAAAIIVAAGAYMGYRRFIAGKAK
ncbi:MAG: hypothetical protein PHF51_01750 [Candidatus ainarchaeum sp.]|nr:hypothetical protein [Candidatus ainarchaeum sp.]